MRAVKFSFFFGCCTIRRAFIPCHPTWVISTTLFCGGSSPLWQTAGSTVKLFLMQFVIQYFPKTVFLKGKETEEILNRNVKRDESFLLAASPCRNGYRLGGPGCFCVCVSFGVFTFLEVVTSGD